MRQQEKDGDKKKGRRQELPKQSSGRYLQRVIPQGNQHNLAGSQWTLQIECQVLMERNT